MRFTGPRHWGPIYRNAKEQDNEPKYQYRIRFYAQFGEKDYSGPTDALCTFKYGDIVQRVITYARNRTIRPIYRKFYKSY